MGLGDLAKKEWNDWYGCSVVVLRLSAAHCGDTVEVLVIAHNLANPEALHLGERDRILKIQKRIGRIEVEGSDIRLLMREFEAAKL